MTDEKRLQHAVLMTGLVQILFAFYQERDSSDETKRALTRELERFGEAYADAHFQTNKCETAVAYAEV